MNQWSFTHIPALELRSQSHYILFVFVLLIISLLFSLTTYTVVQFGTQLCGRLTNEPDSSDSHFPYVSATSVDAGLSSRPYQLFFVNRRYGFWNLLRTQTSNALLGWRLLKVTQPLLLIVLLSVISPDCLFRILSQREVDSFFAAYN